MTHTLTLTGPNYRRSLSFTAASNLRELLVAQAIPLRSACGGHGICGQCLVRVIDAEVDSATQAEIQHLSAAQRQAGWRLACQLTLRQDTQIELANHINNWRTLCTEEPQITANPQLTRYAAAVDLGTTHIRVSLCDRQVGKRIAGCIGINPQAIFGADVLTRLMQATASRANAMQMSQQVQDAIEQALQQLTLNSQILRAEIGEICVVGNTTMLSLLTLCNYPLLLQPEYWTQALPCIPENFCAWSSAVRIIPPLAGFIGSDIWAGILATRLFDQPAGSLLIDFGTNTEMALWDGQHLHITAAAGGPAFEGCGIGCGMPAEAGAIYRVQIADNNTLSINVLGNETAQGICGSGLVDILACLRSTAQLDRIGRLRSGNEIALSDQIRLTSKDIDVLQRAKAAIAAGIRCLCQLADMTPHDLQQIYAAGAFGHLLDIPHAQAIGLLPTQVKIQLQGDTALVGCEQLLSEPTLGQAQLALVKIYNLAEHTEFERCFIESLYLEPMQA